MSLLLLIDPGHGGTDPGGGNNAYWKEKEMTLQISLYQLQRFTELGVSVDCTRKDDITLSSTERSKMVRDSGAEYCISNHINSGGGEGSETIYSVHEDGLLARRIMNELVQTGMKERRVFNRTLPGNPKKDYYYMHRETGDVQTVIVEYGFADNPGDTEKIRTGWKDLAEAVVRGFCRHNNIAYIPPNQQPQNRPPQDSSSGQDSDSASWKEEAIDWLLQEGLITSQDWKERMDQPLPLWAQAIIIKRMYEKLLDKLPKEK